jgi:hypothetical protein
MILLDGCFDIACVFESDGVVDVGGVALGCEWLWAAGASRCFQMF